MTVDRHTESPVFGDLLRQHRLAAGLTQEELAERAGLSARGISDLERGARTHPHRETARLQADALGLSGAERSTFLRAARRPHGHTASTGGRKATLPVPLTPLIGRREERDQVGRLLGADAVRLLTLTGPGGVGKKRLALAVAEEIGDAFPEGLIFVDLAPLRDPALVLSTVATALGLREAAGRAPIDGIRAFLRERAMLLLLDNFEHLLAAAPVVTDILVAGLKIKVLATSRAPLHLRGEREYPVPPLSLPTADETHDLAALADTDAVAFFLDRAQAVRPDFALTAENASATATICARLDGVPLALELAASRVKMLPPSTLLSRLEARLPLLVGGSRDAPERQRTLRAALEWSHDLLVPAERTLFRRLGVFGGGWTLDAAEAVASLGGDLDVLAGLEALADKSLIRLDEGGPEPRYAMLETIREFAVENLGRHAEEEGTVRGVHATFYADLADAVRPGLWAGLPAAMQRVRAEEDNLRAMLAYLLAAGDAETVLRVAGSILSEYWFAVGGRFGEGRAWLERGLRQGEDASPAARGWGLYGLATLAAFQGDVAAAGTAAAACYALARTAADPFLTVRAPSAVYMAEEAAGRAEAAAPFAAEAVAAARAFGDSVQLGWALLVLGNVRWRTGDLAEATARLEEGLGLFRESGSDWGQAEILTNLARVAGTEGDLARAAQRHAEALTARLAFGEMVSVYDDLVGLAVIALTAGRHEAAARLLGAEETLRVTSGFAGFADTPVWRERTRQDLLECLGDEPFARAWAGGSALSTDSAIAEALALANDLASRAET